MSDELLIVFTEEDLATFLCRFANEAQQTFRADVDNGRPVIPFNAELAAEVVRSEPYFKKRRISASPMLLAAAPDLLSACEAALPLLAGYSWTDEDRATVKALSATIAKAKGEEN